MSSSPLTVLVFGALGQVGTELRQLLGTQGNVKLVAIDRDECDLCSPGAATAFIESVKPQAIINAAAYTAVDQAESSPVIARILNVDAPREMAVAAREVGALFIHFSTDYIFDGSSDHPWVEDDNPAPLNVYGQTKLDGERAVLSAGAASFIFRTSWVYGSHGANFLLTMLRLGQSKEELSVVSDQVGAPTWSRSLAELAWHTVKTVSLADGSINLREAMRLSGVYHATCAGVTNWHEFATAIFEQARQNGIPVTVRNVKAIRSEDFPTVAQRPRYSVLSNRKLKDVLGFALPEWQEALASVVREVAATRTSSAMSQP